MIQYAFMINEELEDDEPATISAEDQSWDEETLKQLREEYNIIFMTSGDGIHPIMVLNKETYPLFVIGSEDDGTIFFDRKYGRYEHTFSPYWVDTLISDLTEAVRFCGYKSEI